ncbi:hypothetical protein HMPREF9104_00145 [Lentilactobacillus kisonensis F0435]|uniref:Uncharacterized protein n=1 Tax=Lentilactobacillus kisonensis F0435 TaxID=797516 RepID=H1LC32_9LACO|nr:hypothetical protein HMPREF9104_00145 [Lentilactobacillus kisonensis F0435]
MAMINCGQKPKFTTTPPPIKPAPGISREKFISSPLVSPANYYSDTNI